MKQLSPLLYNRRNKKKILASINAVMVAVCFVWVLYTFTDSILAMVTRNATAIYKNSAAVMRYEKPIDTSLINEITNNKNVDRIVPTVFKYGISYRIPGSSDIARAVPIRAKDMDYFMKKQGIKLIEGNLPEEGKNEIAINKDIAKNRHVKIGDIVGDGVEKFDSLPGEYKIVGILDSGPTISVLSANESILPGYKNEQTILGGGFYVFPKSGRKAAMDSYIGSLSQSRYDIYTESIVSKDFERDLGSLKVIEVISILAIIVMVITVGSSKYAQYINRKEELGVLNAIGYNKKQILSRTFKEVLIVNVLGFVLGIAMGVIMSYGLARGLWEPVGCKGFLYSAKGLIEGTLVPLFTILFSIIPINNLINKLDPIKMIEKN